MDLKDLGELDFIRALKKGFAKSSNPLVIRGIGDDTSVTVSDAESYQLATTDSLVQGVHFSLDYFEPALLGKKALQVSLSDIAAMGGVPRFFLVSLSVPPELPTGFIDELYDGFKASSKEYSVELVGGNTTSSGDGIVITTTVLGEVPRDEVVYRDGARAGDRIYVTGTLGDSALGLSILKQGLSGAGPGSGSEGSDSAAIAEAVKSHLDPVPRLKAGRMLAKEKIASSMIDISDGLVMDLARLMEESNAGARIEFKALPISKELTKAGADLQGLALTGGEDYELLFTVPSDKAAKLQALKESFDVPITEIGEVTERSDGVIVIGPEGKPMELDSVGYEHFKAR